MSISTDSIKRLISEKGITKAGLELHRAKGLSWKEVGFEVNTRKTWLLDIARYFGIDTTKRVTKLRPEIPIRKPIKPFPKLPYTAIRRVKEAVSRTRAIKKFYRILKKKKPDYAQGWYVLYEQEVCNQSPPCDPDSPDTHWELRTQKASWFEQEPNLDQVKDEIVERNGFLWRTRNWKMVYSSYKGKIRESKQTR